MPVGLGLDRIRRRRLYRAQQGRCAYCGKRTILPGREMAWGASNPKYATIDHVVPQACGGADHISNVVIACLACNAAKGSEVWEPKFAASNWTGLPEPKAKAEPETDARPGTILGHVPVPPTVVEKTGEPVDLSTLAGIDAHLAALQREQNEITTYLSEWGSRIRWIPKRDRHQRREDLKSRLLKVIAERRRLKGLRREAIMTNKASEGCVPDARNAHALMSAAYRVMRQMGARLDWKITDDEQAVQDLVVMWLQDHAPMAMTDDTGN